MIFVNEINLGNKLVFLVCNSISKTKLASRMQWLKRSRRSGHWDCFIQIKIIQIYCFTATKFKHNESKLILIKLIVITETFYLFPIILKVVIR